MLKVYPLLFILLLVVSCSNRNVQVAKILTDFQKNEIVIPDNLIRIEKGKVLGMEPLPDRAKLIEYIDSSSCSACHIAHLEIVDNLFMMAGSTKLFDVVVVFSPRAEDASEVLRMLLAKKINIQCILMAPVNSPKLIEQYLLIRDTIHFLLTREVHQFLWGIQISRMHYTIFLSNLYRYYNLFKIIEL